jgi:nucleotide-binding universal stress UspA family protein
MKALPKLKRILVPTDLSSLSRLGIDVAVSLARENPEASLALVHVIDPAPVVGITDVGVPIQLGLETCVEQAEDELDRLKSIYGKKLPVTTRVITGHPSRTICQMAQEAEFDLIVLSSHGRTGLERMLIGSVAEQIVQDATCPVLVVKPPKNSQGQFLPDPEELSLDEILVGFDNRPGAQQALGMAGKIAASAHGHLTLIHAVPAGETWVTPDLLRDPGGESVVLSESMRELNQARAEHMPASSDWELKSLIGNPWDVMADYARLHRCDLIVVGPHEHTRWGHGIMGSTAQRVVRLAPCAVLAVK